MKRNVQELFYSDSETYTMSKVNRTIGDDLQLRLQNLQLLLQRILHFYEVNSVLRWVKKTS